MSSAKNIVAVAADILLVAMLQDGRDGGVASPEARRLKGLEGGVGDGGEAQRGARHPGDVIEAARLLVTRGYVEITHRSKVTAGLWRVIHSSYEQMNVMREMCDMFMTGNSHDRFMNGMS